MSALKRFQNFTLYLFAFSLSFEYWDAFGFENFSIGAITGYLYTLSIILYPKFRINVRQSIKYILPLLLFFFILTFSSAINYSIGSDVSWFNMSIFQCIVLFILISIQLTDRDPIVGSKLLLYYVLGSILLTLLYSVGLGVDYSVDMRVSVFGSFANGLGFNLAITFIIILSFVFENKSSHGKIRYLLLLILPLMLKVIAETGSRGAFVTLAIGVIIFILFIKMRRKYKSIFVVFGIISAYGMFIYMLQTDVFKTRLQLALETGDTSNRTEIWEMVLPLFMNNPVFGIGETGYQNYAPRLLNNYLSPHNVFIELLLYTGVVGLISYSMLLYQIFRKSLLLYRSYTYILPGILLSMSLILFLNGQGLFVKLVWLIFAYILGTKQTDNIQPEIGKKFVKRRT